MTDLPSTSAKAPAKLPLVTVPLMIEIVYQGLSLLLLPFFMQSDSFNEILAQMSTSLSLPAITLTPEQANTVLWTSFAFTTIVLLWLYFTRSGLLEGKRWARISAIAIAVFSLFSFPFGTVLGIVMLIGLFDKEVMAFTQH